MDTPAGIVDKWLGLFEFMKDCESLDDMATKSLPYGPPGDVPTGYLRPLSRVHLGDSSTTLQLARWRREHEYAYPTRSTITADSTAAWLESAVLRNPRRLLFQVTDSLLRPVGHLGLVVDAEGGLEVDNVLRGEAAEPRTMEYAMQAMESWCLSELDAQGLSLRVLESNVHAIRFYERLGYGTTRRQDLAWVVEGEGQALRPSGTQADDAFLTMSKDLQSAMPSQDRILTAGPLIGVREATYALDAARHGWNDRHSTYLADFETAFADYIGVSSALATSSCTGALHLALLALGVGPGDEVVVPETTWVATGAAVTYVGATPVFADVDPTTWTMTPESVNAVLTQRTKALLPVHLYGYPADMSGLMALADTHGLLVLEDAAPAIGATVSGRAVGSFGHMAAFSFQGAKMLVTGEGGMLVTNDEYLRGRAWKQQDHGRRPGTFWIEEVGRKYKMSNLTAAIGLAQLQSVETQIAKKRRINEWYREFLADTPGISFQMESPSTRSICWMTSIVLDSDQIERDELARQLQGQGIDTRPVFPPISTYPIWGQSPPEAGPTATFIGSRGVNLPSGVRLSRASVERVAESIDRAIRHG